MEREARGVPSLQHFSNVQQQLREEGVAGARGAKSGWVVGHQSCGRCLGVLELKPQRQKELAAKTARHACSLDSFPFGARRPSSPYLAAAAALQARAPRAPSPPPSPSALLPRPPAARAFVWPRGALGASRAGNWRPEEANWPARPQLMSGRSRGEGAARPGPEWPCRGPAAPLQGLGRDPQPRGTSSPQSGLEVLQLPCGRSEASGCPPGCPVVPGDVPRTQCSQRGGRKGEDPLGFHCPAWGSR